MKDGGQATVQVLVKLNRFVGVDCSGFLVLKYLE